MTVKLKIFIVTYNNREDLNSTLDTLFRSDIQEYEHEVHIINNHTRFELDERFVGKVKVWHNVLRPDFSTGHLARNWNQAIINGFQSLNDPACDVVVTSQDDTHFTTFWASQLLACHERYSFITNGWGDNFCSYTPEAVKNIGLWDERFCNIGYQEADYFLRALMYNASSSSINDPMHGRILNPLLDMLVYRPHLLKKDYHLESMKHHSISRAVFAEKYGGIKPEQWTQEVLADPPQVTRTKNFILYPYFEQGINNLKEKNYII